MRRSSSSRMLLIELIVNLSLFALAALVCLQLFVQAHIKSQTSQDLAQATLRAQSLAEAVIAQDGDIQRVQALLGGECAGQTLLLTYDEAWRPTAGPAAATLSVDIAVDEDGLLTGHITAQTGGRQLLEWTVRHYLGEVPS
jgi:type II secretory pathway component PulJ